MSRYLFVQTEDPLERSNAVDADRGLAVELVGQNHEVNWFLVQNGVLAARRGPLAVDLKALTDAGIRVVADEFSLRERGILGDRLSEHAQAVSIDFVIDELAQGAKTLWH